MLKHLKVEWSEAMSWRLATRFTRWAFNFSVSLLVVCGAAAAARAADAEAVTIDTTFIVKTPPVRLDKPARPARARSHILADFADTRGVSRSS